MTKWRIDEKTKRQKKTERQKDKRTTQKHKDDSKKRQKQKYEKTIHSTQKVSRFQQIKMDKILIRITHLLF